MRKKINLRFVFRGAALAVLVAAAFGAAGIAGENESVRELIAEYGYVGIFWVSIVSGFNLAVPVPAVAFMPLFLESGLDFGASVLFIVLGVTVADLVAYYIGKFGRKAFNSSESKILLRLERIREKFSWAPFAVLFLFASFVPLPNEILLVPFGFLGYHLRYVLPVVFAGHIVFNTLYASGVVNLFEYLRI